MTRVVTYVAITRAAGSSPPSPLVLAYREAVFLLCHSALTELAVAPAAPDENLSVRRDGRGVGVTARDTHDGPPQKAADEGRLVRVAPGITGIL